MTEIAKLKIGDGLYEIPKDVWEETLRQVEDYILDDRPQALEFAIALAIIGERARCAAKADGISRDLRNADCARMTAGKIASLIRAPDHSQAPSPNTPTPERVKR